SACPVCTGCGIAAFYRSSVMALHSRWQTIFGEWERAKLGKHRQSTSSVIGGTIMRSLTFSFMGLILACSPVLSVAHGPLAPGTSQSNRDRIVRVVTISQEGLRFGTNDRMEATMARLNRAASFHPDIA